MADSSGEDNEDLHWFWMSWMQCKLILLITQNIENIQLFCIEFNEDLSEPNSDNKMASNGWTLEPHTNTVTIQLIPN